MLIDWDPMHYSNVDTNATLADLYQANAEALGVKYTSTPVEALGSTDMGNVSKVIPSTHVIYSIGSKAVNHSHSFTTAAASEVAHEKTLLASKAMAMTAIDVLCKPDLIGKINDDFYKSHPTADGQ